MNEEQICDPAVKDRFVMGNNLIRLGMLVKDGTSSMKDLIDAARACGLDIHFSLVLSNEARP